MRKVALTSLIFIFTAFALTGAAESTKKKVISNVDQIPRHSYKPTGSVTHMVTNEKAFNDFAKQVRKDLENDLKIYEIKDKTALKYYLMTILNLDILDRKSDAILKGIQRLKQLEEKEAAKLLRGMVSTIYMHLEQKGLKPGQEAFQSEFASKLKNQLQKLPWEKIQEDIISSKGKMEMFNKNFLLGAMQSMIEPAVKKAGYISSDMARQIIAVRLFLEKIIPIRKQLVAVYGELVCANWIEKPDIWKKREFLLKKEQNLSPVMVAIWDTGVDTTVFPNQLFINNNEKKNGKDTDGNGFVDDVHGIAYDMKSKKVPEILFNVKGKDLSRTMHLMKGYNALTNSIDIPEATALKKRFARMKPKEVKGFIEGLMETVYYIHGTHVAGIAIKGNPFARILTTRLTMDYRSIPDVPTIRYAKDTAKMLKEVVQYFITHKVQVVNMSWGITLKEIENALAANAVGKDSEERGRKAREIYSIMKIAFKEAITSAPNMLFVVAAGNSSTNPKFMEEIPAGLDLPNLIAAGAVDQSGDRTYFTSFGEIVDIYSNGFQVKSFLPGGQTMPLSGTSMAAPNVVNLAGKLLALNPKLDAKQLKDLIIRGADKSKTEKYLLMNPVKSLKLLQSSRQD